MPSACPPPALIPEALQAFHTWPFACSQSIRLPFQYQARSFKKILPSRCWGRLVAGEQWCKSEESEEIGRGYKQLRHIETCARPSRGTLMLAWHLEWDQKRLGGEFGDGAWQHGAPLPSVSFRISASLQLRTALFPAPMKLDEVPRTEFRVLSRAGYLGR